MSGANAPAPERAKGDRTRQSILVQAVDIASVDGLEGLSIGRLAAELHMSKSGLFAHFGSKEELQLATIEAAREIFVEEVVIPALAAPRGLARLTALCSRWLSYARREVFRGGCFFAAAASEFDGRPGAVRDQIAANMNDWLGTLRVAVEKSQELGDLPSTLDPRQLAFELNSIMLGANFSHQLLSDAKAFRRARTAIDRLLSVGEGSAFRSARG